MTIYSELRDRLDAVEVDRVGTLQAGVILVENKGADPMVGIQYSCDFRYEEEPGAVVSAMTNGFTAASHKKSFMAKESKRMGKDLTKGMTQADLVFETDDVIGFASSPTIYGVQDQVSRAVEYLKSAHVDNDDNDDNDSSETVLQAGWFHFGNLLIFEKKNNLFNEVLTRLVDAAQRGTLLVGGGGFGFGSGFTLFDGSELSAQTKADISAANTFYLKSMKELEPVAELIKASPMGHYYFLGKPRLENGVTKYWLNGASMKFSNGRRTQHCGWYTLDELREEKYVTDAQVRSDDSFKRFNSKGHYRPNVLTDEEAEFELKSQHLTWASKPMSS
jgi:hypothetical protein